MVVRPRLVPLLAVPSVLVLLFYYSTPIVQVTVEKQRTGREEIVAYSLRKRIEIEGQEVACSSGLGGTEALGSSGGTPSEEGGSKKGDGVGSGEEGWIGIAGTPVHVYSVFQDRRLEPYQYLRIVGMIKGDWNRTLFCQIYCSDGRYHVTRVTRTQIWHPTWGPSEDYRLPYLLSCRIPINLAPKKLYLSTAACEIVGGSGLHIHLAPEDLDEVDVTTFTVCVKLLDFQQDQVGAEKLSERLLQWLVMNRLLGAGKFEFYVGDIHERALRVLKDVQGTPGGRRSVVLRSFGRIPEDRQSDEGRRGAWSDTWERRHYEVIAYNDCLYRNIHASQFVIPVDVDEIITPVKTGSWPELLGDIVSAPAEDDAASYSVRNAYYLRKFRRKRKEDHPERAFFFRDTVRSELSPASESAKSFVSTRNALTVFNHYAMQSLRPGRRTIRHLAAEDVRLNHYKSRCDPVMLPQCATYLSSPVRVVDAVLLKHKKRFYDSYDRLTRELRLMRADAETQTPTAPDGS